MGTEVKLKREAIERRIAELEGKMPTARIIEIIGQKPLFGHTSGKGGKTIWMCFLKNEKSNETHL